MVLGSREGGGWAQSADGGIGSKMEGVLLFYKKGGGDRYICRFSL